MMIMTMNTAINVNIMALSHQQSGAQINLRQGAIPASQYDYHSMVWMVWVGIKCCSPPQ